MRTFVGIGGTATSLVVLLLPPGVAWLIYLRAVGRIDEALVEAVPEQKASLMGQSVGTAFEVMTAAGLADLVLVVPCAVLAGLALTIPFFLRDPEEGAEAGS